MKGARGVLINITGGPDMTLFEVDEAANRIGEEVDADANIIFGSTMDSTLEGKMRVSVVATGIDAQAEFQPRPVLKVYSQPQKLVRAEETEIRPKKRQRYLQPRKQDEPIAEKKATTPIPTPAAQGETPAEPSKSAVETAPPTPEPVEKPATETVIEAEQPTKLGVGETPEPVTKAPAAPDAEEPAEIVPAAAIAPEPKAPTPPEPLLVAKKARRRRRSIPKGPGSGVRGRPL